MSNDLRTRVQEADPAADLPGYRGEKSAALVDAILNADGQSSRPRGTIPVTHGRIAIAAGLLAAACVCAVAVGIWPTTTASAQATNLLTTAETRLNDPAARGDQYWQVTRTQLDTDGTTHRRIEYIAVDGARPTFYVDDTYPPVTRPAPGTAPASRDVWTMNLSPNKIPGGWQAPTTQFLSTLPTDLNALRARLYNDTQDRGNSVDGEAFTYVADLLKGGTVPADVTKRMYALLRTIPGVDVLPGPATVADQTGTVLGFHDGPVLSDHQLLINPSSGQLIAERNGDGTWTSIDRTVVAGVPTDVTTTAVHLDCDTMNGNGLACTRPGGK